MILVDTGPIIALPDKTTCITLQALPFYIVNTDDF